jgi:hypothetical protein
VRGYHKHTAEQARIARERQALRISKKLFEGCSKDAGSFDELIDWKDGELTGTSKKLLDMWPKTVELYAADEYVVKIRDKEIRTKLTSESLSGSKIRKVSLPTYEDEGEILRFLMKENVPGSFPTPPACSPSSAKVKTPPACSPAKATPSAPTAASRRSPRACPRIASPPPSTRSRCTAATPTRVRTSTARSATPACPSPPSTT